VAKRRSRGEGSVFYAETRRRWVAIVDLPDGALGRRRSKVTARTKSGVLAKLKALRTEVDAGRQSDGSLTFGQLLDRWLADAVPARTTVKSPNTIDNYRWTVERHLKPALGSKRLRALRPEDIESLLRKLASDGLTRNTISRIRSHASMALRWAQRRDLVARNVAELAELPATAKPPSEGSSLTVAEAERLLALAREAATGPLVIVGLMLGLRPGELCGLRWDDVDWQAGTLSVRHARKHERVDGKETLRLGEPKTRKSVRTLAMPTPVRDALQRQRALQERDRKRAGAAWTELGLVFTTTAGTAIDPSNLRRAFATVCRAAGLGYWTPRSLRHSAASLLSAAGVPIEQVADLFGHVDTRMVEKHYRHQIKPAVDAAVAPMEALFGWPPETDDDE
jgi:integrase